MSDDETKTDETTEPQDAAAAEPEAAVADTPAEVTPVEEAPAAEEAAPEPAAPAPEPAEPDPLDDLPWKERRRVLRSRESHKAGSQATIEERAAARATERASKAKERRKERAAIKADRKPGTGTPPAERETVAAKVRQGTVVSSKADKSITVRIDIARRHPTYEKIVRRSRTLHAHDESNEAGEGDVVRVVETRPLSKTKRWRLVDVVEKAR
jgi:small subunit ribosomal protein S17